MPAANQTREASHDWAILRQIADMTAPGSTPPPGTQSISAEGQSKVHAPFLVVGDYIAEQTVIETGEVEWPAQVGVLPGEAASYRRRVVGGGASVEDQGLLQGETVILVGDGGCGKTQLAAARARTLLHSRKLQLLVWVSATSRAGLVTGYAEAASIVTGRPQSPGEDAEQAARRFLAWLSVTRRRWLVVLDDVADPADVAGLWPQGATGENLVTTRRRDAVLLGGRRVVVVGVFTIEEARDYLYQRLSAAPLEEVRELAEDLGRLPLALAQAAAYIIDNGLASIRGSAGLVIAIPLDQWAGRSGRDVSAGLSSFSTS